MSSQSQPLRRSSRLATVIPASYWRRLGYTDLQSHAMERLQTDMKNLHREEDEIFLVPRNNAGDNLPVSEIVEHHDLMLPHWDNFARALKQQQGVGICIGGFQLARPVLETILPSMQHMKGIEVFHSGLGPIGFDCLFSFLRQNSTLLELSVGGDGIDLDIATSFSEVLSNHPTLKHLALEYAGLDNAIVLEKILEGCARIKALSFFGNSFRSASATVIADFISKNQPTETIDLDSNLMSDTDVPSLVESLRKNTNLKGLKMQDTQFTDEGKQKLLKAVLNTVDITSIVQSNHSCQLFLSEDSNHPTDLHGEAAILIANTNDGLNTDQKIRKKVTFALCEKPEFLSNLLQYFGDSPLELAPQVLKLAHEQHDYQSTEVEDVKSETCALSRLFLALKEWRMPALFDGLPHPSKVVGRKRKRKRNCFY